MILTILAGTPSRRTAARRRHADPRAAFCIDRLRRRRVVGSLVAFQAPVQIGGADRLSSGFDEREQAMSKLIDIVRLLNGRHFDREVIILCLRIRRRNVAFR